jgi:signal transduction histidine kinase
MDTIHPHTPSSLSRPEKFLLAAMLIAYIGGIVLIYLDQTLFGTLCFIADGPLAVIFILTSRNRLLDAFWQEQKRADDAERSNKRLMRIKEEFDPIEDENATLKHKINITEQALKDVLVEQQNLQIKLEEALNTDDADHLLPDPGDVSMIDIIGITQAVIDEMKPFCEKSGIHVQLSSASSALPIKADANYIRILFRNIIDNSVKYMQRGGSLVITLSLVGDDLFVVLKDNGVGLSEQETSHIFELNYQGSNRVSGNGLGLAQSKAIVEYYGGTIYAKSGTNCGMAIYIQLPAASTKGVA